MVVKCIVSSYCKTNGNSRKNLYIEKRFIYNLVSTTTMHVATSSFYYRCCRYNHTKYRKRNNNMEVNKLVLEWLRLTYIATSFLDMSIRLPTPNNVPSVISPRISQWFFKKLFKIHNASQLAEIVIKRQLKHCSSYTVYLAWLQGNYGGLNI